VEALLNKVLPLTIIQRDNAIFNMTDKMEKPQAKGNGGVLECWSTGVLGLKKGENLLVLLFVSSIAPLLHYSITPMSTEI
jgi:hypothetical protein